MINSNKRKLALSGWLQKNSPELYESPLKFQKFLFFYECFSKVANQPYDFAHLKGYVMGPVFSTVYGDYTKERDSFNEIIGKVYQENESIVNQNIANQSKFLCATMTGRELSWLTHQMHIWNTKEHEIREGKLQISLEESDFSENDTEFIENLGNMYPPDALQNSRIINIGSKYFVFNKADGEKITEKHLDTLAVLEAHSEEAELYNPVYVAIDEDGGLLVD